MLPEAVLKKAAAQMLDYEGTGQSVLEMSHRSKAFDKIIKDAEALLREVMNIPDNYKVLFLQGGGSTQFAMVALNFMNKNKKADYIVTGQWAKKALQEAQRYGDAVAVASSADKTFTYIPKTDRSMFREDADYVYICMNNTIYGTVYHELPDTGDIPLIADISSCICSTPLDITKFGALFAGAQKNMSGAGVTIAIIREDLLGNAMDITPTMLNYKIHADAQSEARSRVDQERHRRSGEDAGAQREEGKAALRLSRQLRAVQGHRRSRGSFSDERSLRHRRRRPRREVR